MVPFFLTVLEREDIASVDINYNCNSFYCKDCQNNLTFLFWIFLKKFVTNCDKQRNFNKFQNNYYKV